jgi:hypothetical protein
MPEQFENPEAVKVDDKTASDETAKKRIDRVAEKLASKPAKVEQKFDKENSILFTK